MRLHSWIEEEKPNFQMYETVNLIPIEISVHVRTVNETSEQNIEETNWNGREYGERDSMRIGKSSNKNKNKSVALVVVCGRGGGGQQAYIRLNKLHQNERAWVKAEFFRYN